MIAWLQAAFAIPTTTITETTVWLSTTLGRFPVRLIAKALPQEMADHARQRARTRAKKQGRTLRDETLYACGFMLLTNLPPPSGRRPRYWTCIASVGRWRFYSTAGKAYSLWLYLRAHYPRMVQTYLLAKLLLIVMCDAFSHTVMSQVPDWFISSDSTRQPLAPHSLGLSTCAPCHSRLHHLWICSVLAHLPQLQRFLCDTPRPA